MVTPQLLTVPALNIENTSPPVTVTGTGLSDVIPLPSRPNEPAPQQDAAPEPLMLQVWVPPAAIFGDSFTAGAAITSRLAFPLICPAEAVIVTLPAAFPVTTPLL